MIWPGTLPQYRVMIRDHLLDKSVFSLNLSRQPKPLIQHQHLKQTPIPHPQILKCLTCALDIGLSKSLLKTKDQPKHTSNLHLTKRSHKLPVTSSRTTARDYNPDLRTPSTIPKSSSHRLLSLDVVASCQSPNGKSETTYGSITSNRSSIT